MFREGKHAEAKVFNEVEMHICVGKAIACDVRGRAHKQEECRVQGKVLGRPQQPRQAGIKRHSGLVAAGYSKKGSPGRPANAIRGEQPGYSKGLPTP
jgi:hypothetical protein